MQSNAGSESKRSSKKRFSWGHPECVEETGWKTSKLMLDRLNTMGEKRLGASLLPCLLTLNSSHEHLVAEAYKKVPRFCTEIAVILVRLVFVQRMLCVSTNSFRSTPISHRSHVTDGFCALSKLKFAVLEHVGSREWLENYSFYCGILYCYLRN